ncbi:DUF433 domain-containing protein [Panacagrimonas sp.]|uniref:DUF433 domain-containing protein n=1 Tax=Panacagrimonas sp. TaxID=2480088 RepID=UPI003B520BE4
MKEFPRITHDPAVMGGQPCVRNMRATVGMIIRHLANGGTEPALLADYPYLEPGDIRESLAYAAWRLEAREFHLQAA